MSDTSINREIEAARQSWRDTIEGLKAERDTLRKANDALTFEDLLELLRKRSADITIPTGGELDWEVTKAEYGLPNSDVDIGEMYYWAYKFAEKNKRLRKALDVGVKYLKAIQRADTGPASSTAQTALAKITELEETKNER